MTAAIGGLQDSTTIDKNWFENQYSSAASTGKDRWFTQERASQKYRFALSLSMIRDEIVAKSSQQILDLGCGMGQFANEIHSLNRSNSLCGQDISENAVEAGRRLYPDFDFRSGALPTLMHAGPFAGIVALECICYLNHQDRAGVCENVSSRLANGGWFLFSIPIRKGPFEMGLDEVTECFNRAGLRLERLVYNHALPYYALERKLMVFCHAKAFADDLRSGGIESPSTAKLLLLARALSIPGLGMLMEGVITGSALLVRKILSWSWLVNASQFVSMIFAEKKSRSHILALGRKS